MIPLANRKILVRLILIGLIIMLYDVILHSLFMVMHITFEWFEFALEEFIGHIFHTSRQQSQLIVFYMLLGIALYALYRLWRALPSLYGWLKEQLFAAGFQYKSYLVSHWREQSSIQKIKWVMSLTLSVSCVAFFAFS